MSIESVSEFVRLRESEEPSEYRRAATESAPLNVWQELVASHPAMRYWVAQNKTVPLEVLRLLAEDADPRVRSMVASKRKLDVETFMRLARDKDESVRGAVARNPSTPVDVLQTLRRDEWHVVSDVARERLEDEG